MRHVEALSRHHNILIVEDSFFEQTLALRQNNYIVYNYMLLKPQILIK